MAGQIMFFEKNKADFSNANASASASQGNTFASFALNRSNLSAWVTTGSVDADNTTYTVDFTEPRYIDSILLIKCNFKSYTIKYWNGSAYTTFAVAIDVTNNTEESPYHSVTQVLSSRIQVTVRGTMTANQDKYLYQFIATALIGQLDGWPQIKAPTQDASRIVTKMLSGRVNVTESVGGFHCDLEVICWKNTADLAIVETLYTLAEGFLVWICGNDATQFSMSLIGYRREDIYLMRPTGNYVPEFYNGLYKSGVRMKISLSECTT